MFKIFSFEFNLNNIERMSGVMNSLLDNISEFTEEYREDFSNQRYEESERSNGNDFIELKQDDDMYLLTIELEGIDIREVSIRYDPGIIEINLNRSEIQKKFFGIIPRNILVKMAYNKKFDNIEEIDTSQILKNIDNGILSIRMQKKYPLESLSTIVDVDFYEDNVDN
ncbi:hypothetical protein CLPUN_46920 [Clostridium puniceum]|uniref:SHSP domain-containing protein n=1 Tax=Clostridium puniceum TaxID=29367 RepID=A0A1S8T3Z5_9CLOT|nr:Hsp20/alpha crystallin family protein [Clostridium puniceum]OOM72500.1 hypothetical protein CLPUN_46920 [Clostridium puniceum]